MNDFEKACSEVDEEFTGDSMQENVIEWVRRGKVATVNFVAESKNASRIRKYAQEKPDECKIVSDGNGAIVAHIPSKWVNIRPPRQMNISDERRKELSERFKNMHQVDDDFFDEDIEDDSFT